MEISINVEIHCPLPLAAQEALPLLLKSLGTVWEQYPAPGLDRILVVPRSEIPETTNAIIEELTGRVDAYQAPVSIPLGTAVPVEEDGELRCFILIAQEAVEGLTPEKHRPNEAISVVVEEFLHVWLYGLSWERTGRIQSVADPERPCDQELESILGRAFDEYIVNRHKARLFHEGLLVDCEGGWTTVRILYGGDLTKSVRAAGRALQEDVLDVALQRKSVADVWPSLIHTLDRGLVEPLSRNAAPLDADEDLEEKRYEPDSVFYRQAAAPFGAVLLNQLRRAFWDSRATEDAKAESLRALKEFLETIGVTFSKLDDGCYVVCGSDFFAARDVLDPD